MEQTYSIKTLDELADLAGFFLDNLSKMEGGDAVVAALSGDLGAGKTTFVQMVARLLGVQDVVTSPTFTIMKGYETGVAAPFKTLIHMDAYRIESEDELRPLRLAELMKQPQTLICIEWAERVYEALPNETHFLTFKNGAADERLITYHYGKSQL